MALARMLVAIDCKLLSAPYASQQTRLWNSIRHRLGQHKNKVWSVRLLADYPAPFPLFPLLPLHLFVPPPSHSQTHSALEENAVRGSIRLCHLTWCSRPIPLLLPFIFFKPRLLFLFGNHPISYTAKPSPLLRPKHSPSFSFSCIFSTFPFSIVAITVFFFFPSPRCVCVVPLSLSPLFLHRLSSKHSRQLFLCFSLYCCLLRK
ncbi:hypothetical protein BKA57DRAFT_185319 [Linnemannia elongata]|nr:hypothetical protein BKA57DRAFT_185319 [Linnemannia elongata]